jgi:hypothetical protein
MMRGLAAKCRNARAAAWLTSPPPTCHAGLDSASIWSHVSVVVFLALVAHGMDDHAMTFGTNLVKGNIASAREGDDEFPPEGAAPRFSKTERRAREKFVAGSLDRFERPIGEFEVFRHFGSIEQEIMQPSEIRQR